MTASLVRDDCYYATIVCIHTVQVTSSQFIRIYFISEVSLTPEHHVTIEAGQSLQHGPGTIILFLYTISTGICIIDDYRHLELEPVDPSYIGKPVAISQTKADGKKFDFTDVI